MELKLSMHLFPLNEGIMIFSNEQYQLRINKLVNALRFVGNMKLLSEAIKNEGKQDCIYELSSNTGLQWVLNCTFKQGIVGLEMWFQKRGFNQHLKTVFSWQGKPGVFRDAVDMMIKKMGRYDFIHP